MFKKIEGIYNVGKTVFKKLKGNKSTTSSAIKSVDPALGSLTKKRNIQDKVISDRDKMMGGLSKEGKIDVRTKSNQPKINKKMSDILESKAKGGRVGLKRGTGLMSKKSNIQKIKETFGPKQKPQSRMTGKKKKFPDMSGDGKITQKDILIAKGVIPKPKKKVI